MAEKIRVNFLGTGSAIPTKNRNHPCVFIQYKEQNFLFDCGEGTQRQFRKANLNPCKITKIFLTHWHGDHTLGLAGILQTLSMNGYNKTIEIHGPRDTKKNMKSILEFFMKPYLRLSKEEGNNFNIEVFEHRDGIVVENEDFEVCCIELDHDMPCIGYSFRLKEKKRIDKKKLNELKIPNSPLIKELLSGKDIKVDGKKLKAKDIVYVEDQKKICYISDSRFFNGIENFSKDSDLLMIESTYSRDEEKMASDYGHLTSKQAAMIAKKANSKILALLHLSQRYDRIPKKIKDEAKEFFDKKVIVPNDFDVVEI